MNKKLTQERFFAKVNKTDKCWVWLGAKNDWGYGNFQYEGKIEKAHRVAYRMFIGEIPDGMKVLHRCDTPACVNPAHLFLGTDGDNARDRAAKKRGNSPHGEQHTRAILTESQVLEIIQSSLSYKKLALKFSISKSAIRDIKIGKNWKHLRDK